MGLRNLKDGSYQISEESIIVVLSFDEKKVRIILKKNELFSKEGARITFEKNGDSAIIVMENMDFKINLKTKKTIAKESDLYDVELVCKKGYSLLKDFLSLKMFPSGIREVFIFPKSCDKITKDFPQKKSKGRKKNYTRVFSPQKRI